jgi:hypothetical protein
MDATDKALKLTQWLTAAEKGEITFDQVKRNLMADGLPEQEAAEIVGIAQGESDLIMEPPGL